MFKYISRIVLLLLIVSFCNICVYAIPQPKLQTQKHYIPPQSALVIEYSKASSTVLYQQNADAIRHPASLTKIMTVYLLLEALQSGRIKPKTLFRVSTLATKQIPSKLNLKPGSYIRAIDCVKALLVKSANDVAVVVAEGLSGSVSKFCEQMNRKAKSLGMVSTHFENPSGVPNTKQVTSARDIFKLGLALYKNFPQYWKYFALKDFSYNNHHHPTHCKILNWYKGADGAKTGFINSSGFNLWVTAKRYKPDGSPMRLFVVIFGGISGKLRDFKAASLMDKYFGRCLMGNPTTAQKRKKSPISTTLHNPIIAKKSPAIIEEVLVELDAVPINDIVKSSGKSAEYFKKLYKDDDKVLQMLDAKTIDYGALNVTQSKNNNKKTVGYTKVKTIKQKLVSTNKIISSNKLTKKSSRSHKKQPLRKKHI